MRLASFLRIVVCRVSLPHRAAVMRTQQVPFMARMIQKTVRHPWFCATVDRKKNPEGDPHVAAQRYTDIARPVSAWGQRSAIVPPKLAVGHVGLAI